MSGKAYGVGVGPGDPELITLKALRIIKESEVIGVPGECPENSIAYKIVKGAYPEIDKKELLLLKTPMTKNMDVLNAGYNASADSIAKVLEAGKDVAILTLGDPTVYSTCVYMLRLIKERGFDTEIISGITSFCAAAAKFNDSLVDREEQLHVIPASYEIEDALKLPGTKVLMKAGKDLSLVKEALMKTDARVSMIENCGMPDERIHTTKEDIPEQGSYYTLTIVKE